MSNANQSQTHSVVNLTVTDGQQYQGLLERMMISALVTAPCVVFLFINVIMLFTLRSKTVFRETSRYILLFNLLSAETIFLAQAQLLFLISHAGTYLTYPVCGFLILTTYLTTGISPLTLMLMSLERCVAVCYPLRHSTITTVTNTALAVGVVWGICGLNVFTRLLLLLQFPFEDLDSLQMTDSCSGIALFLSPASKNFDKVYTHLVLALSGVAVISSYVGVMIAARSASTDKASARKARKTLLLHVVQLGLSVTSTTHSSVILSLYTFLPRVLFSRIRTPLYVFTFMLPRCLSPLIYGLRDQTIRPLLVYNLCCRLRLGPVSKS